MPGEDNRSGIHADVPHRTARHRSARLGVKPGNRYASRNSLGRRGSKVIHNRARVPPVPYTLAPVKRRRAPAHNPRKSPTRRHEEPKMFGCPVRGHRRRSAVKLSWVAQSRQLYRAPRYRRAASTPAINPPRCDCQLMPTCPGAMPSTSPPHSTATRILSEMLMTLRAYQPPSSRKPK